MPDMLDELDWVPDVVIVCELEDVPVEDHVCETVAV